METRISKKKMEARAAAAISAVLDNDDLLGEILLRLIFPTSLVRAALVCKRWLRLASTPAFLRRFRELHPPHLLGFYVVTSGAPTPRFVPLPQPPELAAVARRASFDLDTMGSDKLTVVCRNGVPLIRMSYPGHATWRVLCPLYPETCIAILPPLPQTSIHDGFAYSNTEFLLPNGGGDGLPYLCLAIGFKEQQSVLDVYVSQEDTWAIYSSVVTEIPRIELLLPSSLIVDEKIYNMVRVSGAFKLISLDLSSSCLSLVNLPEEVQLLRTDLSLENDSEVHLIHVKGSQLRIWLYMTENVGGGLANWLLVNTICLHGICANHRIPTSIFDNIPHPGLVVYPVGVNSGYFFLDMDDVLYLFDIKRKMAKKVFEVTQEDKQLIQIRPCMMVWPPKFPVIDGGKGVIQKNDVLARWLNNCIKCHNQSS